MPTSEARIRANRENCLKSTGPRTSIGREQSRRNALAHGLSGAGTVVAECDAPEVERRTAALIAEMDPKSTVGKVLVGQLATLSVRMERGASQELAASASRARHAVEAFDHEREDRVEELFDTIADNPRKQVRLLKRMPEGVDRLIEGWRDLRAHLAGTDRPTWGESNHSLALAMLGHRPGQAGAGRLEQLSRTTMDKKREPLIELIDEQIGKLETHRETLDVEAIEQDRVEAPGRVLFDFSREGYRAMRYQSEARRMFFKALKDFRQAEAEFAARPVVAQPRPEPVPAPAPLGSFREKAAPAAREPEPTPVDGSFPPVGRGDGLPRGLDGRVLAVGRAVVVPG